MENKTYTQTTDGEEFDKIILDFFAENPDHWMIEEAAKLRFEAVSVMGGELATEDAVILLARYYFGKITRETIDYKNVTSAKAVTE
jgi:hypothetical protein